MRSTTVWLTVLLSTSLLALSACGDDDADAGQTRVENYLKSDNFSRLVLEVDYVDGYEPYAETDAEITGRLEGLVDKPDGVAVERDQTITSRGEDHEWTNSELFALAEDNNDLSVGDNTIKMHVTFVDGHYEADDGDSRILGLAWENQNIVIFKKTLEDSCRGGLLSGDELCKFAERAIWTHEIGHVLGLVNAGVEPQSNHQDIEHGRHCNNDECVMYWAYEGTDVMDVLRDRLGGEATLDFDAACKEDLRVVREGE
ncbi:MAG: hypothetical protein ACOC9W_03040 [Persicimonas sp.]